MIVELVGGKNKQKLGELKKVTPRLRSVTEEKREVKNLPLKILVKKPFTKKILSVV
jgi:hypothetical protein